MKLKRIFSLILVFVLALVLVACGESKKEEELLKSYLLDIAAVVDADFTVDSTLTVGDKTYDLTWTSNNECVKIADKAVDGTYTVTVTRPEAKTDVTITVKLGNETKEFTFAVNPYTVYDFTGAFVFANNKAVVSEDFDLPTTFEKWGKTATIAWESLNENKIKISEDGKKALVNATSAKTDVVLKAKFSYGGEESVVRFTVTVFEAMDNMEQINYWYTNSGISQTLSGYVLGIATVYNASYGNISVYMIDDSMAAGYYVYRGLCDADTAAKIVPGAHITVTNGTNTCFSGYWELNAGSTITVNDEIEAIDPLTTIVDFDGQYISKAPSYVYRQSSLVKLNGWKVVAKLSEPLAGQATTILTLEKDGVQIGVSASKYCESEYSVWADDKDPKFQAIIDKYNSLNVGDYVDVVGYLYARDGDLINLYGADYLTVSSDKGESDAKEVAPVIATVAFEKKYAEAKNIDLVQSTGNVTVAWKLAKASTVAKIENNQLVIVPGEEEAQFNLIGTFSKGSFSIDCYYTIKVGVIDNTIKTIAAAKKLEKGTETAIQGTVMAINTKGYILYDGTAAVYVYVAGATEVTEQVFTFAVGDTIKVEGILDAYAGLIEYIPTKTTRVEINESTYPDAVEYSNSEIQAYVAATATSFAQDYIELTGTLVVSEDKKYFNVVVEGLENEKYTLANMSDELKAMIEDLNGKEITLSGYAIGQSSNKFLNVMVSSIDSALTVKGALKASVGTTVTIEGQVVASSSRGYIVYDGTAAVYVYAKGSTVTDLQTVYFYEEDFITVTGTRNFYNVDQIIPTEVDYALETPEALLDQGKAEVMDAAAIASYISAANTEFPVKLVELTGKVSISNGYYNLTVGDGAAANVTFSYLTDEQKAEYVDGETYTVYAYTVGHTSKNTLMSIIPCSYLAPLDPYQEVYKEGALYVNPEFTAESCSWGGTTLTYGVNGFADLVEAIAAAESGAEIYLQSGEYELNGAEATTNFVIDKDLKIYGPNAGIAGYARQRHPEAVISQLSGSTSVSLKSSILFDGVQFKGKGIGYISHDYFTAETGFKGITIKNSIASHITSFVKVKLGDNVIENCYIHGINQFIAWQTTGSLLVLNNVIKGEDCGQVTNAAGSAFRIRGVANVKIYHNTFIGDYYSYKYFEANCSSDGTNGSMDIQYNNFNCVESFFLNQNAAGYVHKATLNNNIYTDGTDQATEIPATVNNEVTSVVLDTNTFETIEALEEAWAALGFKYLFKVTFDADGGEAVAPIEFTNYANVVLPVTTKEGKAFAGWYNGEVKVEALTANADIALKAKWIDAATLTYDVDGGVALDPVQFTDYAQVTLATPVKEGFEFLGWYNGETKVTALSANEDITLKAKWAQIFTVTFDVDGGEAVENISFIDFAKVTLPYTTKEGKAFAGWYDGATEVTALTANANIALKANWIDPVTLYYNVDGGDALDPVTFTDYKKVELATPTKAGFAFGGWYDGETKVEALSANASITLKAKWIEIVQLSLPANVASKNIDIVVLADASADKGYYNGETRVAVYATFQDAVAAAVAGNTIYLPAGTYELGTLTTSSNYIINKDLTVLGPNAGVAGYAETRADEAILSHNYTGSNSITLKCAIEFDGIKFTGKGIGGANETFFTAASGFKGVTVKNSIGEGITSFVKVKDFAGGDSVIDNCYFHGINQFIAWISGGSLTVTNNVISGADCGGVENSGGTAFRVRGASEVKVYHNTFIGNYGTYPGYFEPNCYNGTKGSLDIQFNVFKNVSNYFFKSNQSGLTLMATLNNNVYTDAEGTVVAAPATLANDIAGVTVDTNTFASVADLEAAWAAKAKIAALAVEYMADWNAASGLSLTAAKLDTNYCDSSAMATALSNATMNAKWGWLYAAINTKTGNAEMAIGTADVTTAAVKGYYFANLCGLFTESQHVDSNFKTTSFDWSNILAVKAITDQIPATQN